MLIVSKLTLAHMFHAFTGGDDNAIHLSEVSFGETVAFHLLASVPDAHASTITGVLSLGNSRFASVGIDQMIRLWQFDGNRLLCFHRAYSFVSDICGILEVGIQEEKRRFVVYGTGMEFVEWEEHVNVGSSLSNQRVWNGVR